MQQVEQSSTNQNQMRMVQNSELHNTKLQTQDRKMRILIVEDDLALRPFWEKTLQKSFHDVELDWETSEERAEQLIKYHLRKNKPYDLVIADIFLDGPETGIDLWNRYGEAARNFMFVSGLPISKFNMLMSLDFGCPIYLQKPLSGRVCQDLLKSIV